MLLTFSSSPKEAVYIISPNVRKLTARQSVRCSYFLVLAPFPPRCEQEQPCRKRSAAKSMTETLIRRIIESGTNLACLKREVSESLVPHLSILAVPQQLVFLLWVEDDGLWCEGDRLPLEGGALVCADEEHLVSFVDGRAYHDHLKDQRQGEVRSQMPGELMFYSGDVQIGGLQRALWGWSQKVGKTLQNRKKN